jgi:hypothetical protein
MSTPIIPTNPSRLNKAKGKDADMSRQKGSELDAKSPLRGSILGSDAISMMFRHVYDAPISLA